MVVNWTEDCQDYSKSFRNFFLFISSRRACRDEIFAHTIVNWLGIWEVTSKMIRIARLCTASSCSTCVLVSPWCHTIEQYSNIGPMADREKWRNWAAASAARFNCFRKYSLDEAFKQHIWAGLGQRTKKHFLRLVSINNHTTICCIVVPHVQNALYSWRKVRAL